MLQEISQEVDYVMESVSLLQHLGAGKKFESEKEAFCKKYNFREGLRKFELLGQIEREAEREFAKDMEQLQYYFPAQARDGAVLNCVGKLVILWEDFKRMGFQDVAAFGKHLRKLSEQEYCETFGSCLQGYAAPVVRDTSDTIKISEPYDMISFLMKMEIKDEEKWKIQKTFFDREEHIGVILGLMERAEALLRGFRRELEELTEMFYQFWTKQLAGQDIASFISGQTKISVGNNPFGFCLQASIIWFNVILLEGGMEEGAAPSGPDYYRIGILFGEDFDFNISPRQERERMEDYSMQVLKLLADKSKFQILSYVRDKSAYGSELAKHLNLTTATVSHHMNALLLAGLVEVNHVDNRVYYTANKEAIREVLDYCGEILT